MVNFIEISNPRFASAHGDAIELSVKFEVGGDFLPYIARYSDPYGGAELYQRAIDEEFGPIAPYVEPEPQPEPVPQSCTRRQGRLALLNAGLLDDVENAIAAITDPVERRAAEIEYEADTWERGNAFLQAMWAQLGGSEQELDDLFRAAVTL